MSETALVSTVVRLLNGIPGVKAMRNNVGFVSRKGSKLRYGLGNGSADIIVCVDGMFLALEGKLPREKLRKSQVDWQNELVRSGGYYFRFETVRGALDVVANVRKRGGQNG